ncbi:MAG: hydroxymethylglutaryl-CoA lyase [Lutisporaceae bacterium]
MTYPKKIEIVEVCPRDGFQNVNDFIETSHKIEIIKKLIDANFKRIEITSFVSPKAIPQMADASEVVKAVREYSKDKNVQLMALVPNQRGVEAAVEAGVNQINYVISVSEQHNMANVKRSVADSMAQFKTLIEANGSLVDFRLGLATTFGCPFGEKIELKKIREMCAWAFDLGTKEILLADTVGLGNPMRVHEVVSTLVKEFGADRFIMHMHDTRGLALVNILAAMEYGIYKVESAVGGLGGCPFAPGAAGNVATEDVINMIHSMGNDTGINIDAIKQALNLIQLHVNAKTVSHMSQLKEYKI